MKKKSAWIDVSVALKTGMAYWPGDPSVNIFRVADMDKGKVCNVSKLDMCAHAGTHMDGPLHFVKGGAGLDTMPLEATVGKARVIELKDPDRVRPEELRKFKPRKGERLLLKTRNSRRRWEYEEFDKKFIHIGREASEYLVDCGIQTVGIDYLSVGGYERDGVETHQVLLGAGIWIIEGLALGAVKPGNYDLICLPVKIHNSDGAPARAILKRRR